jgi:undecaprenyl-diphosphatase
MISFDLLILQFFNQFARHSFAFDGMVKALSTNHLFKGGVLVVLLWWAWYSQDKTKPDDNRRLILATIVSCALAETLARALSLSLPFRPRPLYETGLHFVLPFTLNPQEMKLAKESSFPSDHAVLFYSLSASLWLMSRRAGIFAFIYTSVMIAFPRMYLGLHYPSDILGGAALGIGVTLLATRWISRMSWTERVVRWSERRPELFYPCFFLLMYQIADMFEDCRAVIGGLARLLR